jgi:hypothetical protein
MGLRIERRKSDKEKARDKNKARAKARSIPDIGRRDRRSRGGTHGYSSGRVARSAEEGPPTEGNRSGGGRDSGSSGRSSGGGRSGGGREN